MGCIAASRTARPVSWTSPAHLLPRGEKAVATLVQTRTRLGTSAADRRSQAEAFLSHRLDPPRMRSRSPGAGRGGLEGLPTWRCFPPGPDARSSRGGRGARAWRHPHAPILRAPRAQTWAPGRAAGGAGRSRGRGPPAPAGVMCPCVPGALVKLFSCDSALCCPSAFGFGMCCFQSNSFDVILFCLLIHQMDVLLTCYCEKFQMWG